MESNIICPAPKFLIGDAPINSGDQGLIDVSKAFCAEPVL